MENNRIDLRDRTKAFALRIIRLFSSLPKSTEAYVLGKQVLRAGTSVARTTEKPIEAGPTPSTFRRSKWDFRNWKRHLIGWSCWAIRE